MYDTVIGICVLVALSIVLFFVICVSRFVSIKKQREKYPESLFPGEYRSALILCCIATVLLAAVVIAGIVVIAVNFDSISFM